MDGARILIAGGGIGGLTAAACLLEAGFDVDVFEQAPELGEVGAGIQFSANASHVLYDLGLGPRLEPMAVRPRAYEFRLYDSAELVQAFPLADRHRERFGAPYLHLYRPDAHALLAETVRALKPDAIHLGRALVDFEERDDRVTARFADGATEAGDALIGADGIKSVVRPRVLGDTPAEFTGDVAWRVTVNARDLPDEFADRVMTVWLGPRRHAVTYLVRDGAIVNFVGCVETDERPEESWTVKHAWADMKADFAGWHPRIQAVLDAADRDACYRWALHIRTPVAGWSTGRVTLLGDAAHATLPYLAQGAAMAIEDAAVLARALGQSDTIAAGLDLYQRNRVERTARIVRESTANRTLFHLETTEALKAAFGRRDLGRERGAWLFSYNPLTVELV